MTVVFDNTDKANSPIGYEQYQELTVTRQVSHAYVGARRFVTFKLR